MKFKHLIPVAFDVKVIFKMMAGSYLVFQLVYSCLKKIVNSNHISLGKKRRLSDESVKPPVESNNRLTPVLKSINTKSRVKVNGGSLKQQSVTKYYGNFKKCV